VEIPQTAGCELHLLHPHRGVLAEEHHSVPVRVVEVRSFPHLRVSFVLLMSLQDVRAQVFSLLGYIISVWPPIGYTQGIFSVSGLLLIGIRALPLGRTTGWALSPIELAQLCR
jgi:hypothetical protein